MKQPRVSGARSRGWAELESAYSPPLRRLPPARRAAARARVPPLLRITLLCCLFARADAQAGVAPVLGGPAYALTPLLASPSQGSDADGPFSSASFVDTVGDRYANGGSAYGSLVWDSRNNSVAYVLDFQSIRAVDFATGQVSTITSLSMPGCSSAGACTVAMCGDNRSPAWSMRPHLSSSTPALAT